MSVSNTVIPDINSGIKVYVFRIALHGVMSYAFSNNIFFSNTCAYLIHLQKCTWCD